MATARTALALALLACGVAVHAQDKTCTKADSAAADKAIERVVTWQQLEKAWRDYRQCDTGSVDELYTDALLRLTVEWKNVNVLAESMQKDPQYRDFVYRHLQSPAAKDDRESVYSRAKSSCPGSLTAWCGELAEAVKTTDVLKNAEFLKPIK